MTINIGEKSSGILTYLVFQSASFNAKESETFEDNFSFPRMVADNLDYWLETLDELEQENPAALDIIKNNIRLHLAEDSNLKKGTDIFLQSLADFLGEDYEERTFYKLTTEVLNDLAPIL